MSDTPSNPVQIRHCIERLQTGDPTARDELLGCACGRLRQLARKMLHGYDRLKRWEETDDILQNALVRLWTALGQVTPRNVPEFYALASLQIRRELTDLVRHHFGPQGVGANYDSQLPEGDGAAEAALDQGNLTHEPNQLAMWSEFHAHVDTLPAEERETLDLLWYQGLPQEQAAVLLGVSERTLRRRWWSARRRLYEALRGHLPGL